MAKQQTADETLAAFVSWAATKTDDDFREYVHRGKLKRAEIATECGFGRSAIVQNPAIKAALHELEESLRTRGVLPNEAAFNGSPVSSDELPVRDKEAKQRHQDGQRVMALEQENAALKAELRYAKEMLERYKLLAKFIEETGRLPR